MGKSKINLAKFWKLWKTDY